MQTRTPARKCRQESGFTLVEIMVVVVIIGLLAGLVIPNVIGSAETARLKKAGADASAIYSAASRYAAMNGKMPTLEDLTTPDSTGNAFIEVEMIDPWENEYELREKDGRLKFEVISYGPDGYEDTEDDIVHPKRKDQ